MASFVIHHVAGLKFIDRLENKYGVILSETEKNQFLLGNLIVDSTRNKLQLKEGLTEEEIQRLKNQYSKNIQDEKISTHFRNANDRELCVQTPNADIFKTKYENILHDFSVLGYLFHLYTDKMFFDDLFTESFECLDKNLKPTIYAKDLKFIKSKKNNKIYLADDIWKEDSPVSIYSDYTTMNKIILEHFDVNINFEKLLECAENNFSNPGIEEVDYNNIFWVLKSTSNYIKQSYESENTELKIFSDSKVKQFIPNVIEQFVNQYFYLFVKGTDKRKQLV